MLRRVVGLDGTGLLGMGMDWDGAAALFRRLLRGLGLAGAMFLLCRVPGTGMPAPFAMAFLAAALLAGRSAAALLAGCLAGAANGPLQSFELRLPVGAALVLGGSLAWDLAMPALRRRLERSAGEGVLSRVLGGLSGRLGLRSAREPAPRMQARSPNRQEAALGSALAGAGTLLPWLIGRGEALWPAAAVAVTGAVAAVASAPFMLSALKVRPGRRFLDPEERAGLFLTMGLLAFGLARRSRALALWAAGALTLALYPAGALAGAGLGGALLAASGDVRLLAALALGGAAAQLCEGLSRPARAATACGALLLAGLPLGLPSSQLAGVGAAGMAAIAMPERWAVDLARLARPAPGACDPQRLAARLQRDSARRLRDLGAAFGDLAEGYRVPVRLPDEQALIQRLRDKLCQGCAGYGDCWSGGREGGVRLLCDLIARAVALSGETPLFEGEAPPELCRRCRRGRLIPERLQDMLEDFARARRDELKRGAENRLISAQFDQASRLLRGLAARQDAPLRLRERQSARAAAALERAGIEVESTMALGGRGVEIVAALKRGSWTPELAERASAQLRRAFGRGYAPAGPLGREARFARRPGLRVSTGVLCASGQAGAPCGDSHLVCMLDDERLLALICDGMGSGGEAARESAVAVRLLGRFLRSGAPCELAVETVNALMLNRGGEDMFATVDLLTLNLSTGAAAFTKLAACATLIARDGEVRRVEGGRLPLGILERVSPGRLRARLCPGDVLLMASDGVMDALAPEALEALLLDAPAEMPALARRVLDAAGRARTGGRRDDMTAVCLRVEGALI